MEVKRNVRLIAFYLPQYHPIPENDEWWGKGFTEWTNVVKAKPLFSSHYQPHLPADLGYYDLRVPEVRSAQAELARDYGIHGFCYYHYWFNGKRLLDRPFNEVFSSGEPDFPYCLCWANENWTRRWDGQDNEILVNQTYSQEDDLNHIRSLIPIFADPRYIKIDGKPVFLVYRVNDLPEPRLTAERWRREVRKAGFPGIYLCSVLSLHTLRFDPNSVGFDAVVDFPPNSTKKHNRYMPLTSRLKMRIKRIKSDPFIAHRVFDYQWFAEKMAALSNAPYKIFPAVMPGWDNTPRRQVGGTIFINSNPTIYGKWLRSDISRVKSRYVGEEQLVFINAWNEWAEGNHLEPDQRWGHSYLQETYQAIRDEV